MAFALMKASGNNYRAIFLLAAGNLFASCRWYEYMVCDVAVRQWHRGDDTAVATLVAASWVGVR